MSLRIYVFTDMTESQLVLEQAGEGEWHDCDGLPVYHYNNSGRASYLWTQDKCVYRLTMNTTGPETEDVFREVMGWWRGGRQEERPEEQQEDIGVDQ